jgi:hypothetical protein
MDSSVIYDGADRITKGTAMTGTNRWIDGKERSGSISEQMERWSGG